jgi:branched-chain amino acid aminotransferase
MDDNAGLFYVSDGVLKNTSIPEYTDIVKNRVAYEVIRVIDGVPLFFEDHFSRFKDSVTSIGGKMSLTDDELIKLMNMVINANDNDCCNIKIMTYEEYGQQKYLLYISKSYYPSIREVNRGVTVGLLQLERIQPNAKVLNQSYKVAVTKRMKEFGLFEVLLVNNDGGITEGSKSNVFFVKGNKIFTTPGAYVLKGVTRKYVIEACTAAGFEVVEQLMCTDGLAEIEGVFLSGTSIKVLPVSKIDECLYTSSRHPVINAVREEYDIAIKKYVDKNVKIW